MTEYDRESNVNTPEFWDAAYARNPEPRAPSGPIYQRVVDLLGEIGGDARVVEYGFGTPVLGRMIGAERWEGRDFSRVAVASARAEGFSAHVTRCAESPGYRKAYLAAIEVLEHLDRDEMLQFLDRSKNAPHAFISVPVETAGDERFRQHQRGFGKPRDFQEFLRSYWKHVTVEVVGAGRMLAHCSRDPLPRAPILTVGCSTLLDFHGFLYTAASWRTHHGDFDGRVEFVIVDNHPDPTARLTRCEECDRLGKPGPVCQSCKRAVADMERIATREGVRYIRWAEKQGTYPGKNRLKVEARGKWVATMDSHVLLSPYTIERCLEVIEANPESDDFFHFPCKFRSEGGRDVAIDFRKQTYIYHGGDKSDRGSVYGWTGQASKAGDPYPIAAMITSCYLVRRAAWMSARGYDPILGNYGGWEGPLQLKWWMMGRRVLSLRHSQQEIIDKHGWLHHWHLFCHPTKDPRLANQTGRVHTGPTKVRNFAASSAVIGGESWVRRHCELKDWRFDDPRVQEGLAAGLALRPWFVEQLARPEWEDITEFFRWMLAEKVPGALERW
jgi:hypothetical protein